MNPVYQIIPYQPDDQQQWDEFVQASPVATPLHSQKFLSYHGDRFDDQSLLVKQGDNLIAVFPAAVTDDKAVVISHPGTSYGGLVHDGRLIGEQHLKVLETIFQHYCQLGFSQLIYKVLPSIYRQQSFDDDMYSLFRLNAQLYRVDLSSTVDLRLPLQLNKQRQRSIKKALKNQLVISHDWENIKNYWPVLSDNLQQRHAVAPVHTLEEIEKLHSRFPNQIVLRTAMHEGEVIAGVLLFLFGAVAHAQYIAASDLAKKMGALDYLFSQLFSQLADQEFAYFDFGNSNEHQGRVLNEGLYQYKSGFGSSGNSQSFYRIELSGFGHD